MAASTSPAVYYSTRDQSEVLATAHVRSLLGSGSNGVVLSAVFPEAPSKNPDSLVALKIMSHFWDKNAIALLDCERETLSYLPRHPNIIVVNDEYPATIPPSFFKYLTKDMQKAAHADPKHQTQIFNMEYHPATLETYRQLFPLPLPYHVLWRLARDLVAAVAHMQKHRVVHLDLKMDNILVAYDGRAVLADFGISRVFPSTSVIGETTEALVLPYSEPFPLLMNRLVLAPEVLLIHDAAKAAWHARSADSCEPTLSVSTAAAPIPFTKQGVWSVGVVLYELACWFGHEPSYPDAGGGVRGMVYSLAGIPPLPSCDAVLDDVSTCEPPSESSVSDLGHVASSARTHHRSTKRPTYNASSGFSRMPSGTLHYSVARGYPREFCALVMAMLQADAEDRIETSDVVQALDDMAPLYSHYDHHDGDTASSSTVYVLPDGCKIMSAQPPAGSRITGEAHNTPGSVPVLLRHYSGECRLLACLETDTVATALGRWDASDSEPIVASTRLRCVLFDAALPPQQPTAAALLGLDDALPLCGGAVVSKNTALRDLVFLVANLTVAARSLDAPSILVLDLVPPIPRCINASANFLLQELRDIQAFSKDSDPRHGIVVSSSSYFSTPLSLYESSSQSNRVMEWLRASGTGTSVTSEDIGSAKRIAGLSVKSLVASLPDVDLNRALLYRACLALTGLSNSSLRGKLSGAVRDSDISHTFLIPCR